MTTTATRGESRPLVRSHASSQPSVFSRGAALAVEGFCFLGIALFLAILEYYLAGPLTDFEPSNWWGALAIMVIWNIWTWDKSRVPTSSLFDLFIADTSGQPASWLRIALRQSIRFAILYGIPVLVMGWNPLPARIVFVALVAGTGFLLRYVTGGKAPWDLIAGTTITDALEGGDVGLPKLTQPSDLQLQGERVAENRRARRFLMGTGLTAVVISLLIVYFIFKEAWVFVSDDQFSWNLLTADGWFPRDNLFSLSTLFVATLWIVGIAMIVAGPIGLGIAFYLSEYANPRLRRIVKPIIETLASIPSVVLGFFAISFISPQILKPLYSDIGIFSILAAGIGVGILTIPIVASIAEDAMRAVPQELREASYGLGSRRATTALRVVFPAALSGISAAFIVGISRAIGETMVVALAAGAAGGSLFEANPTETGMTLTAAMASLGAGTDQVAGSTIAVQSLYFLGAVLFVITLLLNLISDRIVRRFREAY